MGSKNIYISNRPKNHCSAPDTIPRLLYIPYSILSHSSPYCSFPSFPLTSPAHYAILSCFIKRCGWFMPSDIVLIRSILEEGRQRYCLRELAATIDLAKTLFEIREVSCESDPHTYRWSGEWVFVGENRSSLHRKLEFWWWYAQTDRSVSKIRFGRWAVCKGGADAIPHCFRSSMWTWSITIRIKVKRHCIVKLIEFFSSVLHKWRSIHSCTHRGLEKRLINDGGDSAMHRKQNSIPSS